MRAAEIDHRLDREEHAGLEHDALAGAADVDDVRLVMEQAAEAVAAEIAHHAHVLGLDEGLDGVTDVAGGGARLDNGNAAHHRLVRHLDQPLGPPGDLADRVHAARIAVPAVEDQRDIDVDDVAFLHRLVVGDAVADDVVERGTGRLAVAAIHQRRRQGAVVHGEVVNELVDGRRRHAGLDVLGQHIEAAGGQLAGLAHAVEGCGTVDLDLAGFTEGRQGGVDVGHHGRNVRIGPEGGKFEPSSGAAAPECQPNRRFYRPIHPRYGRG